MSEPWTPGPWTYQAAATTWRIAGPMEDRGEDRIAYPAHVADVPSKREADARLIALAPDLIEWITEVLDEDEGPFFDHDSDEVARAERGRALLARARGEA